jgi:hypothetical protein
LLRGIPAADSKLARRLSKTGKRNLADTANRGAKIYERYDGLGGAGGGGGGGGGDGRVGFGGFPPGAATSSDPGALWRCNEGSTVQSEGAPPAQVKAEQIRLTQLAEAPHGSRPSR